MTQSVRDELSSILKDQSHRELRAAEGAPSSRFVSGLFLGAQTKSYTGNTDCRPTTIRHRRQYKILLLSYESDRHVISTEARDITTDMSIRLKGVMPYTDVSFRPQGVMPYTDVSFRPQGEISPRLTTDKDFSLRSK